VWQRSISTKGTWTRPASLGGTRDAGRASDRSGTARAFRQGDQTRMRRGAATTVADAPKGREGEMAVLKTRNKYCSNCLATQRFLDLGTCLVCERCTKRLERVGAAPEQHRGARIVAWADHVALRREAV